MFAPPSRRPPAAPALVAGCSLYFVLRRQGAPRIGRSSMRAANRYGSSPRSRSLKKADRALQERRGVRWTATDVQVIRNHGRDPSDARAAASKNAAVTGAVAHLDDPPGIGRRRIRALQALRQEVDGRMHRFAVAPQVEQRALTGGDPDDGQAPSAGIDDDPRPAAMTLDFPVLARQRGYEGHRPRSPYPSNRATVWNQATRGAGR